MRPQTFEKFGELVKSLGIRFYGNYAERDEVPWEAIEAHLLERYGETFLGIEDCLTLAAFALFYVRSTDLEWYRVLMMDEAFRPLTAAGSSPPPVATPEEVVPLIEEVQLTTEQIRRMALHGFIFSVWLISDQVRQVVSMCESEAEVESLQELIRAEMESDPEAAR